MSSHEENGAGWSPFAVTAIAALVLALGAAGAVFGIHVANVNAAAALDSPSPTSEPTPTPTDSGPTPSPTPTPTPTPSASGFPVPDLSGMDFQAARQKLRDLKLGWQLVFEGGAGNDTVRATSPAAGTTVHKGVTVTVYVAGPAPLVGVPDLRGHACGDAADAIVNAGLYPVYDSGRVGTVTDQTPQASDPPTLHWNDSMHITCQPSAS